MDEIDMYTSWYARGHTLAKSLNAVVNKIIINYKNDDSFEEIAFYDGLRDNLNVDPEEEE